jgi:cyanophycinase
VGLGWRTFEETGMSEAILDRRANGAVLVGISAGAIQLGHGAFDLVPRVIDVHDESAGWETLSTTIESLRGAAVGLGIPSGGGVVVHPDGTIEPVRRPAHEFRFDGTRVIHSLLPNVGHHGDEVFIRLAE